jgi:hypothetical protein
MIHRCIGQVDTTCVVAKHRCSLPSCSFCLRIVQVTESESMSESESYTFGVSHRHHVVIVLFILLFLFFLSSFSSSYSSTSLLYACVSLIQIYIYICKMHFRLPSCAPSASPSFFFQKKIERTREISVMDDV